MCFPISCWRMEGGDLPFAPVVLPAYLRLDPDYYRPIQVQLKQSGHFDFWEKTKYPRFTSWPPRILLLTSTYFLIGELQFACQRAGIPYHLVHLGQKEVGQEEFVREFLQSVLTFLVSFAAQSPVILSCLFPRLFKYSRSLLVNTRFIKFSFSAHFSKREIFVISIPIIHIPPISLPFFPP